MSAHTKNQRSNGHADSDYCPTPASCARALVAVLPILPNDVVVDVGAGNGAFSAAVDLVHDVSPIAVEAFPSRYPKLHQLHRDGVVQSIVKRRYETWMPTPAQRADWTIGNPPYSLAELFLAHALYATKPGGYVALLLRYGFMVTAGRTLLMRRDPPRFVYGLQTRPTFYVPTDGTDDDASDAGDTGDTATIGARGAEVVTSGAGTGTDEEPRGKADAAEYVWAVWQVGAQADTIWSPLAWDTRSLVDQAAEAVGVDRARIISAHWPRYGERGVRARQRMDAGAARAGR